MKYFTILGFLVVFLQPVNASSDKNTILRDWNFGDICFTITCKTTVDLIKVKEKKISYIYVERPVYEFIEPEIPVYKIINTGRFRELQYPTEEFNPKNMQ